MALHSHSHAITASGDSPSAAVPSAAVPSGSAPVPSASAPSASAPPTNTTAPVANTTNVVGALTTSDAIIDKAPYVIKRCDQVVMLDAKRISNYDDFTSRAPAFFTFSAYIINMFEGKDNNKLLESISLDHIKIIPGILRGSKTCLGLQDSINFRNITVCLDDQATLDAVQKVYDDFMTCRMGGDLKSFDPVTINSVLTASCNGFNSTSSGVQFDMPKIRSQITADLQKAGVFIIFYISLM
jgi:hypothetical protein